MSFKISQSLIDKYSAGPPDWKVTQAKNLHENIRKALDNSDGSKFDTFLQGSYRNNTAIKEINDVDIVALYDPWSSPESDARWNGCLSVLRPSSVAATLYQGE
ncbi:nucleotidyltransferase domain-containing protein [Actinomadura sp. B10D3]|uniref:nucleotidyltransferase domain-containing protein n=1 Tax=Actinomadura sp. B10D3 TaxID=3153557 RepID=UPI00325CBA02